MNEKDSHYSSSPPSILCLPTTLLINTGWQKLGCTYFRMSHRPQILAVTE